MQLGKRVQNITVDKNGDGSRADNTIVKSQIFDEEDFTGELNQYQHHLKVGEEMNDKIIKPKSN